MHHPAIGDRVTVYPKPGLRVQVDGITGRFLAGVGEEVNYSYWYHERWLDGSVSFFPWTPTPQVDEPKEE